MSSAFAAPPAQQASSDSLLGKRGRTIQPRSTDDDFDLPLTAFFRRHSGTIEATTIVAALTGLAAFVLPLLVAR